MPSLIDQMRVLFGRTHPIPVPLEPDPAHEGWQPGDLAECLFEGPWHNEHGLMAVGPDLWATYPVMQVKVQRHAITGDAAVFLTFARFGREAVFEAVAFRRARPRTDPVPAADAWRDDVRRHWHPLQSEMS